MECSACGSANVAWDHQLGLVVCQDCGVVAGEIIVSDSINRGVNSGALVRRRKPWKSSPVARSLKRAVERGWVVSGVRDDGSLRLGAYRSYKASLALREEPELVEVVRVVDEDPLLKCRTLRVRLALGMYAALRSAGLSKSLASRIASSETGVSVRTIERISSKYRASVSMLIERAGRRRLWRILDRRLRGLGSQSTPS